MSNVHKLKLDISKGFINVNEPVGFRQGDGLGSTVIQAEIYDHGQPFTDLSTASFYCTKPDLKVVMNDPATVNGNKITYIINPQVGASSGTIERAFFLVNDSPISTENFQIKVLNGTRLAGDSTDYLPGFDQIQQEWQAKLEELRSEIKNIDLTEEITKAVNEGMNKVQADVNDKVQSTIDAINIKMKDLDATQESVNKAISDANTSIEKLKKLELEIDSWLEKEHQYVVDNVNKWKSEFDKQLLEEEERLDTTDKTITSLNSRLDSISASINDIDVPQINADVKKAKEDSAAALTAVESKADKKDLDSKIEGATLNGKAVVVSNKKLNIQVTPPDLTNYATKDDVKTIVNSMDIQADDKIEDPELLARIKARAGA
ncbi:hypothetical protein [Lactobacillus terrae]|uniref:hypothetical protein n=1 Tax=Lactobacillus terrae TaxID=2269374 RepID=UPI000C1B6CFF|nr:hypothetical protein [Lactobacillus terrae]